jgi:hypothetical protein
MQWSLTKPDVTGLVGTPDTESFEQSVRRSVVLTRLEDTAMSIIIRLSRIAPQ